MQKIQLYLLPNTIKVVVDQVGSITEFKKVYQKKIKIYKGADNILEFDIRNNEQRRVDTLHKTLLIDFYDLEHMKLFSVRALPAAGKHGIMLATIGQHETAMVEPQQLRMSALLETATGNTMTYSDDHFGLLVDAELYDGYNSKHQSYEIIDTLNTFNYEYDRKSYVSEIGRFGTRINNDLSSGMTNVVTVEYQGSFQGSITVEATNVMSTSFGIKWTALQEWDVTLDSQRTYTGEYRFIRFIYPKYSDADYTVLTGNIDKILIRN